jgi:flagellar protein FlgJ
MESEDARRHLARAWAKVMHQPAPAEAVALLLAHWALETGHGFAMSDHNFAGLKGRAPGGGSALWWTWERGAQGKLERVRARFRAYATPEEGARDYLSILKDRYADALTAAQRGDADSFVNALERRGYFTEATDDYRRAIRSLTRSFAERHP